MFYGSLPSWPRPLPCPAFHSLSSGHPTVHECFFFLESFNVNVHSHRPPQSSLLAKHGTLSTSVQLEEAGFCTVWMHMHEYITPTSRWLFVERQQQTKFGKISNCLLDHRQQKTTNRSRDGMKKWRYGATGPRLSTSFELRRRQNIQYFTSKENVIILWPLRFSLDLQKVYLLPFFNQMSQ